MIYRSLFLMLVASILLFTACGDDDDPVVPTEFLVMVENVSVANTVDTDRANGTVPLSPPVYAVFRGDDPMFVPGELANLGTERIAEDGFPTEMLSILEANGRVSASGASEGPNGPVFSGEMTSFTISATPGDILQFETMFVQSNDWFYGFSAGGLELFNGDTPVSGNVTDRINVYDAGTEVDTAPGTGPDQKPVQEPTATDIGTPEMEVIQAAANRHSFTIPANNAVIRVTVTPQ